MRYIICFFLGVLPWQFGLAAEGGLKLLSRQFVEKSNHNLIFSSDADLEPFPPLEDAAVSDGDIVRNFVSATLGSNMVLQRDQPAVVWGYSKKGAIITTSLHDGDGDEEAEARLVLTTTVEGDDGLWRQTIPPQAASLKASSIKIKSTSGETQTLENILFGDVYICGGQSNMEFSLPGNTNGTAEANRGNKYPHIRVFTVGKGTSSKTLMPDLQTVKQKWSVANNQTLYQGGGFGIFSAVCWFFGREVADALDNQVPIGLISNNWGGTAVQKWRPDGELYKAMINPYMVGPMKLSGFTWYQGEANAHSKQSSEEYAKLFPAMIEEWRKGFHAPDAYFGFVQLSTWCPGEPLNVAELRQSQMAALKLAKVGYATNADMGAGCNIHPPPKQYCGARLGKSALALQYGKQIHWKSPSFSKATAVSQDNKGIRMNEEAEKPSVVVELKDVTEKGIYSITTPYNAVPDLKCEDHPVGTCVGAEVLLNGKGWVNATVAIKSSSSVILTAVSGDAKDAIVATSYGWGSIPMMTLYDKGTDLPVLPWNEKM